MPETNERVPHSPSRPPLRSAPAEIVHPPGHDPARWMGVGEVMRLAVPSVLGTVSFAIMQFVDGWMVSHVPGPSLAARLTPAMASFAPIAFCLGLLSVVSTFASQYLGAGRAERAAVYGWQGLWISAAAAAAMAVLGPLAGPIMAIFGHSPEIRELEVPYFRILVGGAFFTIASQALTSFFIGIQRPLVPFVAGVAGNVVNLVVAYALIFGKFGAPELGLIGAGIGSVAGGAVMLAVILGCYVAGPVSRQWQVRRQWRVSWPAMVEILRLGAPAGAMFLGDILMWAIFMGLVIGQFGAPALAATNILNRYWQLCFMPALGVSAAATSIVGRYCGAGQPRLAWRRAHVALILVEIYMVGTGIVMWLSRESLVGLFIEPGDPPMVRAIATETFIFILLCQAFDALNVVFIGALRGAGDTLWPWIIQLSLAYGVGLGGSALVAHLAPGWGVDGPWTTASLYIALLGLLMWARFLGGRWKAMGVVSQPGAAAEASQDGR